MTRGGARWPRCISTPCLRGRIRDGEYPAGAKLPAEGELAEEFGCEPGTAALALRALQREGLARRIFRKGYFSSGPHKLSRLAVLHHP